MLRKVACGEKAMTLFSCFEAKFQFKKPFMLLKQLESFSAAKYLRNYFITFLSVEYNSLFGCDIVSKIVLYLSIVCQQCSIDDGLLPLF